MYSNACHSAKCMSLPFHAVGPIPTPPRDYRRITILTRRHLFTVPVSSGESIRCLVRSLFDGRRNKRWYCQCTIILAITMNSGMCNEKLKNLGSFSKSNGVTTEIIHSVIATEENVTCTGYSLAPATHAVPYCRKHSPTTQILPPSGRLMSIGVKADKHEPCTFKM